MNADLPKVTIYSDGACNPNPGPGGWAAVLMFPGQAPQELVGGEPETTNNRMELRAALEALRQLSGSHQVQVYTDSNYLRRGISEWLQQWEAQGWRTSGKTAVKNQDLWQALAAELGRHRVSWHWTRGHAGHPWNERADQLARSAIPPSPLPLDDERAIHLFTAASYLGREKMSGEVQGSSSNRLHLQAAIAGLAAIKKPLPIHLYTTSNYLKEGATQWVRQWSVRNWQTREGKPVSHRDLWEELAHLTQAHQITWHVVPKSGPPAEMLQTKQLASEAARSG
jgi:ribonuclease HI